MLQRGRVLWENFIVKDKAEKTVDEIFREGTLIDNALKQAVHEAVIRHKQAGNPIVAWRDGKTVWIKPEDITTD